MVQVAFNAHAAGKLDEAEALFRNILKKKPREARAMLHIGIIFVQKQQLDAGIEWLRKALAINVTYGDAYTSLGNALCEQGENLTKPLLRIPRGFVFQPRQTAIAQRPRQGPSRAEQTGRGDCRLQEGARISAEFRDRSLPCGCLSSESEKSTMRRLPPSGRRSSTSRNLPKPMAGVGFALTEQGRREEAVTELQRARSPSSQTFPGRSSISVSRCMRCTVGRRR